MWRADVGLGLRRRVVTGDGADKSGVPKERERDAIDIDTTVPHPARVYDYLLGGVDNFAVDREAAERAAAAAGGQNARADVRANRAFLGRAVRYLAGEVGIRQFLDIGTGIPNSDNVHAVAQQTAPEARIVYVDKDPVVLAHAHRLLESTPEGSTAFVLADLHDPDTILKRAAETLDFSQPVGLILVAVLHFFPDESNPFGLVKYLVDAIPSGSHVVLSHLTDDFAPEVMARVVEHLNRSSSDPFVLRPRDEIARFVAGLELVEAGLVQVDEWLPDPDQPPPAGEWRPSFYSAVGLKP